MGGPPWPPLFPQRELLSKGAATEGRPYKLAIHSLHTTSLLARYPVSGL